MFFPWLDMIWDLNGKLLNVVDMDQSIIWWFVISEFHPSIWMDGRSSISSVSVVTLNDLDKNDWHQTTKKYSKNHVQNDTCCLAAITGTTILITWGSFYQHGLTLISAWISNYIHYKVWDGIIYPFRNFNGCTVEVWEWISNFIPHFTRYVNIYPFWD